MMPRLAALGSRSTRFAHVRVERLGGTPRTENWLTNSLPYRSSPPEVPRRICFARAPVLTTGLWPAATSNVVIFNHLTTGHLPRLWHEIAACRFRPPSGENLFFLSSFKERIGEKSEGETASRVFNHWAAPDHHAKAAETDIQREGSKDGASKTRTDANGVHQLPLEPGWCHWDGRQCPGRDG